MEKHRKNISKKDSVLISEKQSHELINWIRTLQQALTVEVNRDLINVRTVEELLGEIDRRNDMQY